MIYLVGVSGCVALHEAGVPGLERLAKVGERAREAEGYRSQYQTERDPQAMLWLLEKKIQSGMTVSEVNQALGEDGIRQFGTQRITTGQGEYRTGDRVYKWGPDSKGSAVLLVFRDGKLVNFDPREYSRGGEMRSMMGLDDSTETP